MRTLAIFAVALAVAAAQPASAQLPDAEDFLRDLGFNPDQISQVSGGSFVEGNIQASNERELVVALAFLVQTSPTELVNALRQDLLDRLDPNTIAYGVIEGAPSLASFEKLSLDPDEEKRTKAYADASPDGDLNLSAQEVAAFDALGAAATPDAVEAAVKKVLMARLQAYQGQGLAGIAPYARGGGKARSAGDDLRSATTATKKLEQLVPNAYQALLAYPNAKPAGFEDVFEWSHYNAQSPPSRPPIARPTRARS